MIKYKVLKPFVYKNKVYSPGGFFDENDRFGVTLWINKRFLIRVKIEDGKEKKPTMKDVAKDISKLRKPTSEIKEKPKKKRKYKRKKESGT